MSKQFNVPALSPKTFDPHPGGAKRLSGAVDDYILTMQHALRSNLITELERRANEEAGVLPALTPAEMFDYLVDSDPEFYNWCFPFCAFILTKENIGYLHQVVLSQFRASLNISTDAQQ